MANLQSSLFRLLNTVLSLLIVSSSASGQHFTLSGKVSDAESLVPLPSATIKILGSSKGTVTNSAGEFRLTLPSSNYNIAVSYLGYQSDTFRIDLSGATVKNVLLVPNAIQLAGVTVTDEDPAYEIVRRAIASKKNRRSLLTGYEGKAFNRLQLRTDSSIAAITEAYSTLFWKRHDTLREVITQQKKTGNLPPGFQPSRVGTIVNFNDDSIALGGYTFIGPTSDLAFTYYDFILRSTRTTDDYELYDIELIPKSVVMPLLKGMITIAERSYAVMNVDVRPNEAFTQLFVNTRNSRYRQTFGLFEERFWLPVSYRFDGTFTISILGISLPTLNIERDIVIFDYTVNPSFQDSLFLGKTFSIDSSANTLDTLYWKQNDVLPLTSEQQTAYATLDSTQTLEKKIAPGGIAGELLNLTGSSAGFIELWFNRAEGFHLGAHKTFSNVFENIDFNAGIGYGFSDKRWKYTIGSTMRFGETHSASYASGFASVGVKRHLYSLSINMYDTYLYIPRPTLEGLLLNSVTALLEKDDVHDYYRSKGTTVTLTSNVTASSRITLSAMTEYQSSVAQSTNFSLLKKNIPFPLQPTIAEGRMNSVTLSSRYGSAGIIGLVKEGYQLNGTVEHAVRSAGGDFSFTTFTGSVRGKLATTMKHASLFPPTLSAQIAGGFTSGRLPPQRYMELYSRFEMFARYGMLRALPRREFYGDSYASFTIDHNFRRMLFAPLGIQWLNESSLDLIVEANVARSWLSANVIRSPFFPAKEPAGWYVESSIGVSNILDIFRVDVTRRLSAPADWVISMTISDFLTSVIAQQ